MGARVIKIRVGEKQANEILANHRIGYKVTQQIVKAVAIAFPRPDKEHQEREKAQALVDELVNSPSFKTLQESIQKCHDQENSIRDQQTILYQELNKKLEEAGISSVVISSNGYVRWNTAR